MLALLTLVWASPPATDAERAAALHRAYERYDFGFPKVETIDASALRDRMENEEVVLVDVRPEAERRVSILPGAISLDDYGLEVLNFEGSILAWTHLGGPLTTPSGEATKQVRVYGKRWDYAADGYEPVLTKDGAVVPAR